MRRILRDPKDHRQLIENGYTRVSLLSAAEVTQVLEEMGRLRPDDAFSPNGRGGFEFTYHCTFLDTSEAYRRQADRLLRAVFAPRVADHLLDYQILNCNFYVKPPGGGKFQIHQNWPALADLGQTSVTVWCPLVDVDEANGTIQVVPRSHKIVPDIAGPTTEPYFKSFEDALIRDYLRPISLKAGEALIFDDSLLHWSDENRSAAPRSAVQILCTPAEGTAVFYFLDPDGPEPRFEMFEVDSEFFLSRTITDLVERPVGVKSLGFVRNPNRPLTEEEFAERLRRGDEIRSTVYSGKGSS